MPGIYHEVIIGASSMNVYAAISTQQGLRGWWTPGANARPVVNSIARIPFGPRYFKEMKVVELVSDTLIKWECITGAHEWIGTNISFELQPGDRGSLLSRHPEAADQISQNSAESVTLVIFHHSNWKEHSPMYAECNYTWGQFLRSLKLFCETGMGQPWPGQHKV